MSSQENDAYPQGGSLSDMAAEGTTVPSDSAEPRYIPSKARPDQVADSSLGATDLAGAADNAGDVSRVSKAVDCKLGDYQLTFIVNP